MKKKKFYSKIVLYILCFACLAGTVDLTSATTSAESQMDLAEDQTSSGFLPQTTTSSQQSSTETTTEPATTVTSESAQTSTRTDSQEAKMEQKSAPMALAADGYTEVATNAEFEQALKDKMPKIRLTAALTFDRNFTINHNVVIDFQNLDHNTQNNHIFISEIPTSIEFQNFKMTAPDPASLVSANQDENAIIVGFATDWLGIRYHFTGTLRFTGGLNIYNGAKLSTLYIPQGTVVLDGVSGNIDLDPIQEGLTAAPGKCYFARVYRLEVKNGSQLTAPYLSKFYGRLTAGSEQVNSAVQSGLFVSGGSKISIAYDRTDSVKDEGEIIDTLATNVFFQVDDPGTEFVVQTQIDIIDDNNRGIVQMRGEGSQVNVSNGGKLQIDTKTTSAFRLQGKDSQVNAKTGGKIEVNMEHDKDVPGNNGMRFVGSGLALSIDGAGSSVKIDKKSGKSPAVRFENGNQTLKVTNGGSLVIHNAGDGHEYNNRVSQGNQAILFDDTTGWFDAPGPANFIVEGEKANIDIRADSGAAIDTTGDLDLNFSATEKTYLVMVGKTGPENNGIISGNKLTVTLKNPMYFDFQNRRVGSTGAGVGGWVFQGNGASSLDIEQSEIALWRKNEATFSNFDQDPNYFSDVTDLHIAGTDLGEISSSSSADLYNEFMTTGAGMKSYNRISANNQLPVVDQLRVPTNADKKIYGHVSVPEGLDAQLRDAWTDEVEVTLKLTYADASKAPVQFTARTVGQTDGTDGLNPWGEGRQGGLFEIDVPNNQYLTPGDTIQVISAKKIRGNHLLTELDTAKKTVDIVPPEPAILTTDSISPKTTEISGTGEIGADVLLMKNGTEMLQTTTVDQQGKFTLKIPEQSLVVGDQLEFFLRDHAGEASSQGVINKPSSNDSVGNFNPPGEALQYHDATFLPATKVIVEGYLSFEVPETINFGTLKATGVKAEAPGQVNGPLVVSDQRSHKQEWSLKVKESKPFTSQAVNGQAKELNGILYFAAKDNDYQVMSREAQTVTNGIAKNDDPIDLSSLLTGQKGFKVILPGNKQFPGNYQAEITWILEDAPQE